MNKQYFPKQVITAALVVALSIIYGCPAVAEPSHHNQLARAIASVPPWRSDAVSSSYDWLQLIRVAQEFQSATSTTAMLALTEYAQFTDNDSAEYTREMHLGALYPELLRDTPHATGESSAFVDNAKGIPESKPYLLLRMVFQLPRREYGPFYAKWIRPMNIGGAEPYDLSWPISWNHELPSIIANCEGRVGAAYLAVDEYLYFYHHYPLRDLQKLKEAMTEQVSNRVHDADRDGLSDAEEDQNLNGKWDREQGESNFHDADSDDDGLSDAFESGLAPDSLLPFYDANEKLNACNPDTDGDGLPDGFEVGISVDESGIPLLVQGGVSRADTTIAPSTQPRVPSTDIDATATFDYGGEKRKCFSPSTDMLAITDPTAADTNYDGALDGEHARSDSRGFIRLEDEPGVGWNSSIAYGNPELSAPYRIKGIYTEKNGRIVYDPGDKGSNELKIVFQSPSDWSFDESSTRSILLMNDAGEVIAPQAKDSDSTEPAIVISIVRMVPEKRLWLIRVEFTGNYDTRAPRAEQVTRISIDPARNIMHGHSRSAPVAIPDILTEFDWSLHVAPQGCQIID